MGCKNSWKKTRFAEEKILFHQDNAPAHTAQKTITKITELKYELLQRPPYSPDLAPSDFWLFPHLKKFLRGKHFSSNEEFIAVVEEYFAGLAESHFHAGINKLEDRWIKCIDLMRDYTEQ